MNFREYDSCVLCPRKCSADRNHGRMGYCKMSASLTAARAALHMWEEPCISGDRGSGAVFFSGCTLRCDFCQNHDISTGRSGRELDACRLSEIFLELQGKGAANINLVTAAQFLPHVISALEKAKENGLTLPVVYNTSGYENRESLERLRDYVDIWLPDMKYADPVLAENFSHAKDYVEICRQALEKMVSMAGKCEFDTDGYLRKGVIVRHLILPGHTKDSKRVLEYLHQMYGEDIYISIMNQYTPISQNGRFPELNRKVTRREYDKVLDYAAAIGIENGFFQYGDTAKESFIPLFDAEGIEKESQ